MKTKIKEYLENEIKKCNKNITTYKSKCIISAKKDDFDYANIYISVMNNAKIKLNTLEDLLKIIDNFKEDENI